MGAIKEVFVPDIGDFKEVESSRSWSSRATRCRQGAVADHRRVRQGDDGDSLARRGRGEGTARQGRRQGERRHGDPGARGGRSGASSRRCAPAPAPAAAAPSGGGTREVNVPDIGDFKEVDVVEVLVKVGDTVAAEQSLISVESDKATMEIPSPAAGVVKELRVKVGDKVSEGSAVLVLQEGAGAASAPAAKPAAAPAPAAPRLLLPRLPLRHRPRRARRRPSAANPRPKPPATSRMRARRCASSRANSASISRTARHRPQGPHPAAGRAELREGHRLRRGVRAGCSRCARRRGRRTFNLLPWPQVDFAKFGPIESQAAVAHQEALRREPAPQLGDDSARHQ